MRISEKLGGAVMHTVFVILLMCMVFSSCKEDHQAGDTAQTAALENDAKFISEKREQDAQFLVNAAAIHLEAMKLGLLAQQLGKLDDVKALGLLIETEHTALYDTLKALCVKKKISIPTEVTHDSQEVYDKMNAVQLTEFDKMFCGQMVTGHEFAIDLFERTSNGAYDPEIRAWAQSQLVVLRGLLEQSKANLLKSNMFIPEIK